MPTDVNTYQYDEDSAHVSGDRGTGALAVRNDAGGSLVSTDGDYTLLQTDSSGNLRVVGTVSVTPPVPVTDNGGSLTVDGTVAVSTRPGTLANGTETAVAGAAVQVLAANANRKKVIIQNVGLANVRVGVTGVTATTGVRLRPNGHVTFSEPDCPTQAIFAIREGAVSSTVLAQEVS